jgi:hypothetical protein
MRKPLTQAEIDDLNGHLERAALRAEASKRTEDAKALRAGKLVGVRATLERAEGRMTGTRIDSDQEVQDARGILMEELDHIFDDAKQIRCTRLSLAIEVLIDAKIKREREVERAGRFADIMGANV